jgi:lipoprotein-anchoring transpeptidase ErfK/SrfK
MMSNQSRYRTLAVVGAVVAGSLTITPIAQAAGQLRGVVITHRLELKSRSNVAFSIKLEDQLLAGLRYLPVALKPAVHKPATSTPAPTTTSTTTTTTTSTIPTSTTPTSTTIPSTTTTTTSTTTTTTIPRKTRATSPTKLQSGTYVWRYKSLPSSLRALWRVGTNNVVLEGALMRFQYDHGLTTTGAIDTATWDALIAAANHHDVNRLNYNYVVVSKNLPQTMRLYVDGKLRYSSPVNTGISVAPTQSGTYPVYVRYTTTTMSGNLPNGQPYSDPGIPWVSYFHGGDALHGFIRASYGWPQSLGCVEMPFANAKIVWPRTPIGTLVTVSG